MPRFVLPPNTYRKLRYTTPLSQRARYWLEASGAVTTYVVDADGLWAFEQGETVPCYGGFSRRRSHAERVAFDYYGRWYLIVSNRSDHAVHVEYEVYS